MFADDRNMSPYASSGGSQVVEHQIAHFTASATKTLLPWDPKSCLVESICHKMTKKMKSKKTDSKFAPNKKLNASEKKLAC